MTAEQIEAVNRALYRPLHDGRKFEAVMPSFKKIVYNFDKRTDNHNTFKTLEFMEQWSKKYSYQCAKLAKLLQGKSVQETCNNIYNFLYNHFQYKLDGEAQDLRALSAAWYDRSKGMDCKSYSLLAAMILENLNIKCAFRMVKIGGNDWVHVYVIVPDGQKYHVIDATRHDNREVRFTQKHDRNMYHRGLASPIPMTGLGCSCNGQSINKYGLGNPNTLAQSVSNFHVFLNQLEKNGVSPNVTNTMLNIVKSNVQRGIDPNMQEVFQMAVAMNRSNGLGFVFGSGGGPSVMGINANTAASAYMGDPAAIKAIIAKIIPTNFISGTFGAVFANGLDFTCWGASLTPQTAKANVTKYHTPHFNYRLTAIQNAQTKEQLEAAINIFIKDVYSLHAYYTVYKPKAASWSSCAKKGIKLYVDFMAKLKTKADELVTDATTKGAKVTTLKDTPLTFWFRTATTGTTDKEETKNNPSTSFVEYPQLSLTSAPATQTQQPQNLVWTENANGTVTVKDTNTGQTETVTKEVAMANGYDPNGPNGPSPTKSGISTNTVLGIGAAGALAFMLFAPKKDVTKSTPQNRTTKTKSKIKQ